VIGVPWSVIQNAVSLVSFALNTVQGPLLTDHGALREKLNFSGIEPLSNFARRDPA
jgi:hypothetical protein